MFNFPRLFRREIHFICFPLHFSHFLFLHFFAYIEFPWQTDRQSSVAAKVWDFLFWGRARGKNCQTISDSVTSFLDRSCCPQHLTLDVKRLTRWLCVRVCASVCFEIMATRRRLSLKLPFLFCYWNFCSWFSLSQILLFMLFCYFALLLPFVGFPAFGCETLLHFYLSYRFCDTSFCVCVFFFCNFVALNFVCFYLPSLHFVCFVYISFFRVNSFCFQKKSWKNNFWRNFCEFRRKYPLIRF